MIGISQSAVDAMPRISRWLHRWVDEGVTTLSVARRDGGYLLRFPRLCDLHLDPDAGGIHVMRRAGIEDNTLEHLLVDQALPRLLAHQGELIAHASALIVHGRAVLFLGTSGAGKSTLAALMQRAGHQILSDDCTLLRLHGGTVTALATYPSLRLLPDSLQHAVREGTHSTVMTRYSDKRRVHVDGACDAPEPVHAIYVLDGPSSDSTTSIEARRPATACLDLIRHSFQLDVTDQGRTKALLARCSEVTRHVPAFRLSHAHAFEQSDALIAKLCNHIDTLPAH